MARRTPRSQETRDKILATALELFSSESYHAVGVEDIAAAAGLTKGAVYYWFTDKDDIGRDLLHQLYGRLADAGLHALDPGADTLTSIRNAFEVHLDALGGLGEARFFLRDAWTIPALDAGTAANERDAISLIQAVLGDGVDRGEISEGVDVDALAHVLYGALAEATLHVLTTGRRDETMSVIDLLLTALRPNGPLPISGPASAPTRTSSRGPN